MSNFEKAVAVLLTHEAGFVDNPADSGGPTNLGITIATLTKFRGIPATVDDIRALRRDEAEDIYHQNYWEPCQLDWVESVGLATAILDQAALRGCPAVIKDLQGILGAGQDGVMGTETLAAVRRADAGKLLIDFINAQQLHYVKLCVAKPSQLVFLVGWLARTHSLLLSCIPSV